jgi:hypothetical protein
VLTTLAGDVPGVLMVDSFRRKRTSAAKAAIRYGTFGTAEEGAEKGVVLVDDSLSG